MQIIGVTGYARSGKDSIGRILVEKHGYERYALANEVKTVAVNMFGWSADMVNGVDYDREIPAPRMGSPRIDRWPFSVRRALQVIGTELGRNLDPDLWIDLMFDAIYLDGLGREGDQRIVVTDVRFLNEAAAVHDRGGQVWRVVRPGVSAQSSHASEVEMNEIVPDHTILNDGTLEDLERCVALILGGRE